MMPTEVRIYTISPGKLDEFVELFASRIMPTCAKYGVRIHAAWLQRENNEFVWIRSYDDAANVERYFNSPERAAYSHLTGPCIAAEEIRVVESVLGELPVANE